MPLTARHSKLIERALEKNGFVKLPTHHNRYRYYALSGKPTNVHTYISHGSKDYGDQLLKEIANQVKLTKKNLLRFIDGDMRREECEAILKAQGFID